MRGNSTFSVHAGCRFMEIRGSFKKILFFVIHLFSRVMRKGNPTLPMKGTQTLGVHSLDLLFFFWSSSPSPGTITMGDAQAARAKSMIAVTPGSNGFFSDDFIRAEPVTLSS